MKTCTYKVCHIEKELCEKRIPYTVCKMVPETRVKTCTYQVCKMVPETSREDGVLEGMPHRA